MKQYVGLDVSMEETSVCVVDEAGSTIWEGRVASDPTAIVRMLHLRAPHAERVGLETGPTSTWLWHELRNAGVPVICIDARHAQAALSMRLNKTDRNDAAGLAQLMRMGWYREVQVKQLAAHGDGALLASRALLVRQRCELENQIRGLMKNFGLRVRATKGNAFEQSVRSLAARSALLKDVVLPLLAAWSALRLQIAVLSRAVNERAKNSAVCQRLMTMPGVGPLTSLAFSAAIDDPARFKRSASVGAYVGLTPRRYASGEIDRMGRISRCGDALMRSYLYEAANIMLVRTRGTNPLKSWATKLAKRAGHKKARVALARKMAVVLHRMWLDGTDFGAQRAA
ncbi:MAG: IS110 family transposase [Rhizomicrobium sp.]